MAIRIAINAGGLRGLDGWRACFAAFASDIEVIGWDAARGAIDRTRAG